MHIFDLISQRTLPWIAAVDTDLERVPKLLKQYLDEATQIFVLDGEKMRSFEDLYDEFHLKFDFPDYFGRNGNAVIDCFRDLAIASFSPVVIVIDKFDAVLQKEQARRRNMESCAGRGIVVRGDCERGVIPNPF